MKITLVTNHDDWEGLYVDGKLYIEGHVVRLEDVAEVIKLDFEQISVNNEWLLDRGDLPSKLEEVVRERN